MTSPSNGQPAAEEVSNCKPSRKNIPLPTFSQAVALALVKGNIDGRTRHNVAGENASFYLTIYPWIACGGEEGSGRRTLRQRRLSYRRSGMKVFVSGGVGAVTMGDISS